jgi:hypothetical protein
MNNNQPLSKDQAPQLLAELDDDIARLNGTLTEHQEKRRAIARLRAICEPYQRENPKLTVAEALVLDRRARPWAYRKVN